MEKPLHRFVTLEDVEVRHRESPRTFSIPRSDQRRTLRREDIVKLVFEFEPESAEGFSAERMWVEVLQVTLQGYVGRLSNDPAFIAGLSAGDRIEFEPRHVVALWVPDDAEGLPFGKLAIVSRQVVDLDLWPAIVQRAAPAEDSDSGWIVLSGRETDAYQRDLDNFVLLTIDELIERFRVLDSVLDEPRLGVWQWDEKESEYVAAQ